MRADRVSWLNSAQCKTCKILKKKHRQTKTTWIPWIDNINDNIRRVGLTLRRKMDEWLTTIQYWLDIIVIPYEKQVNQYASVLHYITCFTLHYITCFRKQKVIWHGANSRGHRVTESYCGAWDSDRGDVTGIGSSLLTNRLLDAERFPCNNAFILLCVEITSRKDLFK